MNRRQFLTAALAAPFATTLIAPPAPTFAAETPTFRVAQTFSDAHGASCRVRVADASGSGTFVGIADGFAWILTNYHVVGKNATARLDFWTNSTLQTVDATVGFRAFDPNRGYDFAFCLVDPNELAKIAPPFVELGQADAAPSSNAFIISSGCPKGRFAQAWRGQVVSFWNNSTALFQPPPVPGQSGSGILEFVGGRLVLVAVLTWLIGEEGRDDSKGGALPVSKLREAFAEGTPAALPNGSPIPPGAIEAASQNSRRKI